MATNKKESSRRQFLFKTAIAGSLLGFGCPRLLASNNEGGRNVPEPDKAVEETIRFVYQNNIPIYQGIAKEIGEEKLNKMLQKITAEKWANAIKMASKDIKEKNIENYAALMASILSSSPYNSLIKYEIVEKTDKVFETKYTECLLSKIYKEMGATDIGWSIECSAGDSTVKAFNPKMEAKNPKNFMKGDDVCIERIELKA
jgi:hypothetical protein